MAETFLLDWSQAPFVNLTGPPVPSLAGGPCLRWPEQAQAGTKGAGGATPRQGGGAFPDLDWLCERAVFWLLPRLDDDLDDKIASGDRGCETV